MALKARGHEVCVLTGMPNYPDGKIFDGYSWRKKRHEEMEGIPIVRVPLFARREGRGWQMAINFLSFALSACLLAPWVLRGKRFDVIFTYEVSPVTVGLPAVLMAKIHRARHFFWVLDLWPETLAATGAVKSPGVLALVGKMVRWIYRNCDRILLQSKSFVQPVLNVGAEEQQLRYFPNWAEALYQSVVPAEKAVERKEMPDSGFVVMFAGNLGAAQALDSIVEAAECLKDRDIHWVILGDGRRRAWLESQVQAKCLAKVHILGSRPMQTMPTYFALADAMLVTLKDDPVMSTTIPGKVQSYLACGRPIIGALSGAGADVIHESGAGYVVPPDDVHGLARVVGEMSRLPVVERNKMGKAARDYYEQHFERDMLIDQLESWMQEGVAS